MYKIYTIYMYFCFTHYPYRIYCMIKTKCDTFKLYMKYNVFLLSQMIIFDYM